jgi:hypothetical protein
VNDSTHSPENSGYPPSPTADYVGRYRDVQLGLIEGTDRPVGPILQSVFTGSNAELMRAVAPIYLAGGVLDVTYGRGKWWDLCRPDPFAWHDLALDGIDCRSLPELDSTWDTVAFDPPYVEAGTPSKSLAGAGDFFDRYGVGCGRRLGAVLELIAAGTREACRVARSFVLVKCMEYVAGSKFNDGPTVATLAAMEAGWTKHDQIVHWSGGGIGGAHRTYEVLRAARAHSYLLVFAPLSHSEQFGDAS